MPAWIAVVVLLTACGRSDPAEPELVPVEVAPGELHVPTRTLDFGTVDLHASAVQDLVLSNVGSGPLHVFDLQLSDDRQRIHWSIAAAVEQEIPPGETVLVPIDFSPSDVADPSVVLTVLSSDPTTPRVTVELTGEVQGVPVLRLEPEALAFGDVEVGQEETLDIVMSNLGNDDLAIQSLTLDAQDGYTLAIDPTGSTLAPGQTNGLVSVAFTPESEAGATGLLTIATNDPARPELAVVLTGTGI